MIVAIRWCYGVGKREGWKEKRVQGIWNDHGLIVMIKDAVLEGYIKWKWISIICETF